jgi:hypothetical protein
VSAQTVVSVNTIGETANSATVNISNTTSQIQHYEIIYNGHTLCPANKVKVRIFCKNISGVAWTTFGTYYKTNCGTGGLSTTYFSVEPNKM